MAGFVKVFLQLFFTFLHKCQPKVDNFPYPTGYSDHTKGIIIPIMAVSMGATVIEKHFTLDKNMEGPDHKASLDVDELKEMVKAIRDIESAKGSGEKQPAESELNTREVARKSIVAAREIKKGHTITREDLCLKRPGDGILPKEIDKIIGKTTTTNIDEDMKLTIDMFK